jgi:hypothetical protein
MSRLLARLCVAALLLVFGCSRLQEKGGALPEEKGPDSPDAAGVANPDEKDTVTTYQERADQTPWSWQEGKVGLADSIKHLSPFQTEVICSKGNGYGYNDLTIRITDETGEVCSFRGHWGTVFTRAGDTLFRAEFYPIATGCVVVAVDLKSGKDLWRSRLKGSSCPGHSMYRNEVVIETDGKVVIVHGNESYSRYIEFVDMATGKTLGHREFKNWD